MHKLDEIIQAQFPVHVMPKYGRFELLQTTGHRYLLGQDGLKLEIRRPWLHAVVAIHGEPFAKLPYGECPDDSVELLCGPIPGEFSRRFFKQARESAPNECAAWIVWDEHSAKWDYVALEATSATPEYVDVQRPALKDGAWLVMDFHSHGHAPAFFSPQDNKDDRSEVKLAGVFGNVADAQPTLAMRACLMGAFADLGPLEAR